MDVLNVPELLKLLADVGSTVLLFVVVIVLSRLRDRNEQRDARENEAWLSVLNNISTQAVTASASNVEITNTLRAITRTLTETNPRLYQGYWQGAERGIRERIDEDAALRATQFEGVALKIDTLPTSAQIADVVSARMDPRFADMQDAIAELRAGLSTQAAMPADVAQEMRGQIAQVYKLLLDKARQPQNETPDAPSGDQEKEQKSGPE